MNAARHGNSDVVLQLIDAGADVSIANKQNRTAFMLSAGRGNQEMVKLLSEMKPK
jgi:ankyrin repeat protein